MSMNSIKLVQENMIAFLKAYPEESYKTTCSLIWALQRGFPLSQDERALLEAIKRYVNERSIRDDDC
jgi:hypothetical protein